MSRDIRGFTMQMDSKLHMELKKRSVIEQKTMADLIVEGLAAIGIVSKENSEDETHRNS